MNDRRRDLQAVCQFSSKTIAKSKRMGSHGIRKPYNRRKKINGGLTSNYGVLKKQAKEFYLQSQFSFFIQKLFFLRMGKLKEFQLFNCLLHKRMFGENIMQNIVLE